MGIDKCIEIAKSARQEVFKDSFGEIVDDDSYNYILKDITINVACVEHKKIVIIFVASNTLNPAFYVKTFVEAFERSKNK